MVATVCTDDIADLSRLEFEGGLFEGGLHLTALEEAEVASALTAGALGILGGDLWEELWVVFKLLFEVFDVGDGLFSRACDWFVAVGVEGSA